MREGDRILVFNIYGNTKDYTVEKFRFCLGVFASDNHRKAGHFTPLCALFEPGAYSEDMYIPNYGEYKSNMVQAWMDLPRLDKN